MENMNKVDILGVKFDNVTMTQAIEMCKKFLNSDKLNAIVTPNPEIVMVAKEDKELFDILNDSELVIPDGIGVIIASKFIKKPLKERVAGCDLICNIFDNAEIKNKKVYLFGGKPGIAELAKEKIIEKYDLQVVGTRDGYFKQEDENAIIEDINNSGANILLVALGLSKQEKFISKYKEKLTVKIAVGCGGTIDVLAGNVKRAPVIFQRLGLEWFYRLAKQPSRFFRMLVLPKFLLRVIFNKNK